MISDFAICDLLQAQYDKTPNIFDVVENTQGVDWAMKYLPDCTLLAFEGSHDIPDWISNFEAVMYYCDYGGRVEDGFYHGMIATRNQALPYIHPQKPVVCAGHSRGAAHAHIAAKLLIASGIFPKDVIRVCFGSPRVGDTNFCSALKDSPVRSYRNYGHILDQDYVCTVPTYWPILAPYKHPGEYTYINEPAPLDDEWLFLRRHHLSLYRKGVEKLCL